MASRRQRRVADLIHEELSGLLEHRVADPRLSDVTITAVEVTADLQQATIFYTALDNGEEHLRQIQHGLERAAGYLRRELAGAISLRHMPELSFRFDDALAAGRRIEEILDSLREEE